VKFKLVRVSGKGLRGRFPRLLFYAIKLGFTVLGWFVNYM
jgi:hypothetical protein